ncbi:hypothetical protein T02_14893, partial [Trichinella nativa]
MGMKYHCSRTSYFSRMMSLIQKIINQAELVARSKCDVAS